MKYTDYPGEKTYVVFHTEGTGEQGGSSVNENQMLKSFDTMDEALAYGREIFPRVTGWEWDGFVININTLTETGKAELVRFQEAFKRLDQYIKDHPDEYESFTMDGYNVTLKRNPLLDKPNLKLPNE